MLLDTSGLLCLLLKDEPRRDEAQALFDAAVEKVTHSYVVAELIALATTRGLPRAVALEFARAIQDSTEVEMVWVDEALHREALTLLDHRADKAWSLCDAVSFIVMRQRRIAEALTTDHHFEQAGFVRLLK